MTDSPIRLVMDGVREHAEGFPVILTRVNGHLVVEARNEGGNNVTQVDLSDLIHWVADHPDCPTLV